MRFVRLNVDSAKYEHQELVDKARKKLKLLGYKVYDKEYDYDDFSVEDTNAFGGKSPDVIAKNNIELWSLKELDGL